MIPTYLTMTLVVLLIVITFTFSPEEQYQEKGVHLCKHINSL